MISINEAKEKINQNIPESKTEVVELKDAHNKILAEDITAPTSSPQFDNSAMDGFAVKWNDVKDVSDDKSIKLKIVGESLAGIPFKGKIKNSEAIKINTGAKLHKDVDSVIPVEETEIVDEKVKILKVKRYKQNVRFEGEEFKRGEKLLSKGKKLFPAQLGLLASVGINKIKVYSSPKISIIVTGTELISAGSELKDGEIFDSNSIMISKAVQQSGGEVVYENHAKDDLNETINIINEAVEKSDIIIFCGGVSMGEHDHVRDAAKETGFKEIFWKINQKPGKPLFFARKDDKLFFGLPGNPVSAYMCYYHYVHPVIQKFQGIEHRFTVKAKLKSDVKNKGKRAQFMRVKLSSNENDIVSVEVLNHQASHMLTSIAFASGYILIEGQQELRKNEIVNVYLFNGENYGTH